MNQRVDLGPRGARIADGPDEVHAMIALEHRTAGWTRMFRPGVGVWWSLVGVALAVALAACSASEDAPGATSTGGGAAGAGGTGGAGGGGSCVGPEQSCADGVGVRCRDGALEFFPCDPVQGMECTPAGCTGVCSPATLGESYIGCDYAPTVTPNPVFSDFAFAVAVANAGEGAATLQVTRGSELVASTTLAKGALSVLPLPWVSELKGPDFSGGTAVATDSGPTRLVAKGGYRLRSNQPVTVHQLSPAEYSLTGSHPGCPGATDGSGGCFSFSNDSSLLLPANALGKRYLVPSWPSMPFSDQPPWNSAGFAAVTALRDGTHVNVSGTAAIAPGSGLGATGGEVVLDAGDVLLVTSAPGAAPSGFGAPPVFGPDLTGAVIDADQPVSVVAGHRCAFVPHPDTGYCDHLEEGVFPVETLGTTHVVASPAGASGGAWPFSLRLLAVEPGTSVSFEPPVAPSTTLSPGAPFALDGLAEDVAVLSSKPLLAVVTMQGATTLPGPVSDVGDPSLGLVPAEAQWRATYTFLAPSTYDSHFASLVAASGTTVTLDEVPLDAATFAPVGASGYVAGRVPLAAGVHQLVASAPVGLMLHGYGKYTSYLVPGGLDLRVIYAPPPR